MTEQSWAGRRREIEGRLRAATIAGPEAEARWLTESVSGHEGSEWAEIERNAPPARHEARLESLVARRLAGEPLQYVLGSWSFRSLDLMVDPRVLIPRPETEWVVEVALLRLSGLVRPSPVVVDLGTGSGAIALSIASERRGSQVHATDASADALEVARMNGAGNGVANVAFHHGDWFAALPGELLGAVDLVVSNPPYVAEIERAGLAREVLDHEPHVALFSGADGLDAIRTIVRAAPRWLRSGGVLAVEHAPAQAEAMLDLAAAAGLVDACIEPDLAGRPRVLVAVRP
jgi:release factor glutamine methyltransferase